MAILDIPNESPNDNPWLALWSQTSCLSSSSSSSSSFSSSSSSKPSLLLEWVLTPPVPLPCQIENHVPPKLENWLTFRITPWAVAWNILSVSIVTLIFVIASIAIIATGCPMLHGQIYSGRLFFYFLQIVTTNTMQSCKTVPLPICSWTMLLESGQI